MGLFTATRYVAKIQMIEVDWLVEQGVRCVLMDRDNTCVPRDSKVAPPEVLDWIDRVHAAGITTCVVSNNFHSKQVAANAAEFDAGCVDHAMKPFPFAVRHALRKMGVSADEAVLIGDQVYTDICAGNLAGVRTILVRPQCRRELWYTYVFRAFEALLLRGKKYEGE